MVMGKLLDHWWTFFLAHYSAIGSMAYHPQLRSNHLTNLHFHIGLDLYVGLALGYWRLNLWLRHALSRDVIRQLGTAGVNIGFRSTGTCCLLQSGTYRWQNNL